MGELKDQVWSPFHEEQEARRLELSKLTTATLNEGRRGNLHESHKITIRSMSNNILETLEEQRLRITEKCIEQIKDTTKIHAENSSNLTYSSNYMCEGVRGRVVDSLSNQRLELSATMDSLENISETHKLEREAAQSSHENSLQTLTSSIEAATQRQQSQVAEQEKAMQEMLTAQQEMQQNFTTSIMDVVHKMLEEHSKKMTKDLKKRVKGLRSLQSDLSDEANCMNQAVSKGQTCLSEVVEVWSKIGEMAETAICSDLCDDVDNVVKDLIILEENICHDIDTMILHTTERELSDGNMLESMDLIEKDLSQEMVQVSMELSTKIEEDTVTLLKESETWNTTISKTHLNIEKTQNKINGMFENVVQVHEKSEEILSKVEAAVDYWNECNATTVGTMLTAKEASVDMETKLSETSVALCSHHETLTNEVTALRSLVKNASTTISTLLTNGNNFKCHFLEGNHETMEQVNAAIDAKITTVLLPGTLDMNTFVDTLETSTKETCNMITSLSQNNSLAHARKVACLKASEKRENSDDEQLLESTASYLAARTESVSTVLALDNAAVSALVAAASQDVVSSVVALHQTTSDANITTEEVRKNIRDKTSKTLTSSCTKEMNNLRALVSEQAENVDVSMTSMENQTTTETSSMRVSASEHSTTMSTSVSTVRDLHVNVLCGTDYLDVSGIPELIEPLAVFEFSSSLSSTPDEVDIVRDIVLENVVEKEKEEMVEGEEEVEEEEEEGEEEEEEEERVVVVESKGEKIIEEKHELAAEKDKVAVAMEAPTQSSQRKALVSLDKNAQTLQRKSKSKSKSKSSKTKSGIPRAPASKRVSRLPVPRR